jgi:methyl-accepting chemotaxis protein
MDIEDETRQMLVRRPLKNFVFYPAIQWPQIMRNCMLVSVTAILAGAMILALYHWQYGSTSVYVMDRQAAFYPLERQQLLALLMPALLSAMTVAILLGWLLALSASRRIALPIYKVIQWNRKVAEGNLRATLGFRPGDSLDELARSCNSTMDFVRSGYEDLLEIERDPSVPQEVRERIRMILARYRF